jgi:chaperonin GroES
MIKPLEDKVVVKPIEESEKTSAGGLIIANVNNEKPTEAIVIAVGPGFTAANGDKVTIDLKPGDRVIYSKYSGTEIEHNYEKLIILPYRDIFAVVEG